MSFSGEVKKELCHIDADKKCCMKAELAGIMLFCGTVVQRKWDSELKLRTENPIVARRIHKLIKELFHIMVEILSTKTTKANPMYSVILTKENGLKTILDELGLLQNGSVKFGLNPFLVQDNCCMRSFLRGAFLGGGSVNSPEKSYHFEIETHYYGLSRDLSSLLDEEGFAVKTIVRKSNYVTYIKDSEVIGDFLGIMGATTSMMELYNVKIEKDVKNSVNRRVNCETANMTKTVSAAVSQNIQIQKILDKKGIESLPDNLRDIAVLRLENPDASLKELGEMLNPPISKSGVNHRLNKLIQIAEGIR